jgi:hypothetical protein
MYGVWTMKKKWKIDEKKAVFFACLLLISIIPTCFFSGCTEKAMVDTRGWSHANTDASAVTLYGDVMSLRPADNFKGYFYYDTVDHGSNLDAYAWDTSQVDVGPVFKNFQVTIDGLDRTTRYYYIAVANCGPGVEDIPARDSNSFLSGTPRVSTINATNIGVDSAVLQGRLDHLGGASSCQVWFTYNGRETDHLTLYSTGEFSVFVDGLKSCKTYSFRAVAKNDVSTDYGVYRDFTPGLPIVDIDDASDIRLDGGTLHGYLRSTGGTSSCEVWFRYGASSNQLDRQTSVQSCAGGGFSVTVTGLKSCEPVYYQAVADNGVCVAESPIVSFTPGMPVVETDHIGFGEAHSATLEGELISFGGARSCEVWFEYGLEKDNLDVSTAHQDMNSLGEFSATISGLQVDTTYYYRAGADNGVCVTYGDVDSFRTIE